MTSWDDLARGLELYFELVNRDDRLRAEFEESRAEFFVAPMAARTAGAELRHLEWFLLERPSRTLAGVPALALREEWLQLDGGASPELAASLLESLPGAFEVTSIVAGQGLWVRDLFTQGELPVAAAGVAEAFGVGDLLVGRLYAAGGGTHLVSSAVSLFRNPELLAAIRSDLGAMRTARRGVLRVQQLELEHLFHGEVPERSAPGVLELRTRVREGLAEVGLDSGQIDNVLRRVQAAAPEGNGSAITEILNGLAFETEVDLSRARLLLVDLWDGERAAFAPSAGTPMESAAGDPRAALEAFDRGRSEGKDLEVLFRELERDLGLEDEEPAEDEELPGAPDFPGVVGAMIEEFLWDVEREHGHERAARSACIRLLGEYAQDIGVFEELGTTRLLDFSARWLLDESGVEGAAAATAMLDTLSDFCSWAEERHDVPLLRAFGATLATLRSSVPRHAELRRITPRVPAGRVFRVLEVGAERARLRDLDGDELSIAISGEQEALLRSGDLVRVGAGAGLGSGYPSELGSLLE